VVANTDELRELGEATDEAGRSVKQSAGHPVRGSRKQDLRTTGRGQQPIEAERREHGRLRVLSRSDDDD
jgi:hypothetical protein